MRKRILSFVLVLVLLCTMAICVSAASTSTTGSTGGGVEGKADTSATLYAYTDHATAETWSSKSACILSTSVTLHFVDGSAEGISGGASVTYWKDSGLDIPNTSYATSVHDVKGYSSYGNWTASLRANVW